ncbi:MAG TPA: MFS transporter [Dehalococcoidia bacterium]|nr:MFS transporter [Dehalococcoidia bacterium]
MTKKIFPILALSMFTSILGIGIITPFLSLYANEMGASGIWLGAIFTGYGLSSTIVNPIAGRLSDRGGRKRFIMIGLFIYALSSLGYIYAVNAPQLALVRLVQGGAGGMIFPVALAWVGDICEEGEEGKWMGYATAAFFSGFGFGPLMGGVLMEHYGMDLAFSVMGGLNLLAALLVTFLLPEVGQRKITASESISFREMATSGMIRGIFSFRFSQAIGRGAFMVFLPIFAAIYIGLTPMLVGVLISVHVFGMSLLAPFTGHIADRYNRKTLVVFSSVIYLLPLGLIPLAQSFWYLCGLCILQGIASSLSMTASQALVVEEGRKFGMGSTMAMPMVAMGIGMVIGPLTAGVLNDYVSINSVFYFAAGIGAMGTALFVWFTR